MKKTNPTALLSLLLSYSLLAGCSSMTPLVTETQVAQEKTVTEEVLPEATLKYLQSKNWLWKGSYYNNETQFEPTNPELYQVVFTPENKLIIIADCNRANTTYSEDKKNILINKNYVSTRAYCGDSSLDSQYLRDLMRVHYWLISDNKLILELNGHAGRMEFTARK